MKTNNPELPAEIFDWLENSPFHSLDPEEQKLVLEFLSEEEYNAMHRAARGLRIAAQLARPRGKEQIKSELLHSFDEKHGKRNKLIVLLNQPIRFGSAAALTLLMLSALIWQNFTRPQDPKQVELRGRIDTVLVEVAAAPILVHDTVLIPYSPKKRTEHAQKPSGIKASEQELYISGTEDMKAPINRPRGVSLQADSLVWKFGFVSM